MKKIICLFFLVSLIAACVPPNKFKALQTESANCQEERDRLRAENEKMGVDNKELASKLAVADKSLTKAGRDTVRWKEEVARLQEQNKQLGKDYSDLQEANQALLHGSEGEIRRLMDELQVSQKEMQKREKQLNLLSADVNARKSDLDSVQNELNQRNARLAELEVVLKNMENVLTGLKKKVSDALLGFEGQGLSVTQKNGKVYVSLEEKLLFKSGSTVVDPKGVSALKKLSKVLEQNPDINIMIEGHTDDVPIMAGSQYKDNWDLSVLRATSIVRILLEGSSINPQRFTTAGRSQYLPVETAKTPEARQKNRRTEIILSPKLDELYELINK
jgi:chemotaxis protein MotB